MQTELRKLNEKGLSAFAQWIETGAEGPVPIALLSDPETSDRLPSAIYPTRAHFADRLELGYYLVDLLTDTDTRQFSRDIGFWSALALNWFDLLCPANGDGKREPDRLYRYILSANFQTYYRHLVRSPWQLVRDHGDNARFMLVRPRIVEHPLSVHGEILEQFGGRQRVLGSKPIIRAANLLYTDPETGRPRKGVAGSGPGASLRFGKVLRQLDLTYDPELMTPDQLIEILPPEFKKWKDALARSKSTVAAAE